MRIFKIVPDVNKYQAFLPEEENIWSDAAFVFDSQKKLQHWNPPSIYILESLLIKGNFFGFSPGTIIIDSYATEKLRDLLEMSGELLPLTYQGETFYLLNVTECVNVLDDDKTEWVYGESTGAKIRIQRYAFKKNRLTEIPIFKIPETCRGEILTAEGLKDEDDEFKYRVEKEDLSGLIFEELWCD